MVKYTGGGIDMKLLILLCIPCITYCAAQKPKPTPPPKIDIYKYNEPQSPYAPQMRYRRLDKNIKIQSAPTTPVNKKESEKDK